MKTLAIMLLSAVALFAQQKGTPVTVTNYPTDQPSKVLDYDGSGNLIYVGFAAPAGPWNGNRVPITFSWTFAASTLTSIVVATNVGTATTSTAHGLRIGDPVVVTGSATTALNATYRVATTPSATTLTFTTSGVGDATYTTGLVMTTGAPRTTVSIWSILCMNYNTSNLLVDVHWVGGAAANAIYIWDNRATLPCQ